MADRDRTSGDVTLNVRKPEFRASWPCKRCGVSVPVTSAAIEQLAFFNGVLATRREPPIALDEIVECDDCRKVSREELAAASAERARAIAEALRTLRDHEDPAAAQFIRASYGRIEAKQLLDACREERASKTRRSIGV